MPSRLPVLTIIAICAVSIAPGSDAGADPHRSAAPPEDSSGRTGSLARFRSASTDDPGGPEGSLILETLRRVEPVLPDLRPSRGLDLSESVIRVFDADGKQYEERKIRFGKLPTDLMLDLERRAEKAEAESIVGVGVDPKGNTVEFYRPLTDPLLYTPILIDMGPCN